MKQYIVLNFKRCHHQEKLREENMRCLCLISYNCTRICDYFKTKSLTKKKGQDSQRKTGAGGPQLHHLFPSEHLKFRCHWLLPPGTEYSACLLQDTWMSGIRVQKLTATCRVPGFSDDAFLSKVVTSPMESRQRVNLTST